MLEKKTTLINYLATVHTFGMQILSAWRSMLDQLTDRQDSPPLLHLHSWSRLHRIPHTEAHYWMLVLAPSHKLGLTPVLLL